MSTNHVLKRIIGGALLSGAAAAAALGLAAGTAQAFNPQPDPPGRPVAVAINPQLQAPGISVTVNPQPDPPGRPVVIAVRVASE